MPFVIVQVAFWDKSYIIETAFKNLKIGDYLLVKTDRNLEIVRLVGFFNQLEKNRKSNWQLVGLATNEQLAYYQKKRLKLNDDLLYCRQLIEKYQLPMKLFDIHYSFDSSMITLAFSANKRIDFRQLVRDLAGYFGANIRLHQIGPRLLAKLSGTCGQCGRRVCCLFLTDYFRLNFYKELKKTENICRGNDRDNGVCGRLMCCLNFEDLSIKENQ